MLPKLGKNDILKDFNRTESEYPSEKTVHQLFEEQAAGTPDRTALVGTASSITITYKALNDKAGQLAGALIENGVKAGTIAAVMLPPSIDMVVGILAILKTGAAYLPIDPGYPRDRIDFILKDSNAKIVLPPGADSQGKSPLERALEGPRRGTPKGGGVSTLAHSPENLAYIIYTSGSTGKPKGVMVEHRSVVNILFSLSQRYPLSCRDSYLLKTSYIFDVSVSELFGWFLDGGRLIVPGKGDHKDPRKILDIVHREAVTHINFVPSMFNVFVDQLDPGNIRELSSLKYIFLAGEALLPQHVTRFRALSSEILLENLYGPTEGTVYASGYSLSEWAGSGAIPIGKPLSNVQLYVLDKDDRVLPVGIEGELCIGGTGVARGYLNNPELTAQKFTSHPSSLYHTGDLVRWLPDGNIEFLGRLDHQVKIRGFRVELGEIENRLLEHDAVKEAAVLARADERGDKYLCAYVVAGRDIKELREFLSLTLPGYMIPAHIVNLDKMPLTVSGKIDRRLLPEPEIETASAYTAPRDQTEKKLVEIWSRVLGRDASHESQLRAIIGIDDHFLERGGHSLKAAGIVLEIHRAFNVRLSLEELFKIPSIRPLAAHINEAAEDKYLPVEKAENMDYYPLSSAQKRLYILNRVDPQSTNYNIPIVWELPAKPESVRLENALKQLILRHESFRTYFTMVNDRPVQRVLDEVNFSIHLYPSLKSAGTPGTLISHFIRPFDLSHAPLLRVALIETGESNALLMVDMHHIVSDGISIEIFQEELIRLYDLEELPSLNIQYKDYVLWRKRQSKNREQKRKEQELYWLKVFEGEIPVLNLPLDYARPAVQSFEGSMV
ncbi:MAG: amino acid adenylation domain-containing protein, partial [bacterium]|nr:amino acid adenylation domain-containing protein [bacterium]